jgi:hypothetical protein
MAKPNYPKGVTPKKSWDFPPDIFWITPDGGVIDVIGHLTALQGHPETFGLHASPRTKREVDDAFRYLWERGWVRGRFSGGTFSFQMERPRGIPLGNSFNLVLKFEDQATGVEVAFSDPEYAQMGKWMTAEDFLAQKFPVSWRINPMRGHR